MEKNKMWLLAEAISMAAKAHCEQKRRDGTPYIYHPLAVAEMVKENGASFDCQIAAVLHDTLEDTDVKEEEIAGFGENVVRAVKLLTRKNGTNEADYVRAILQDPIAKAVKEADKIHNLRECVLRGDDNFCKWYAEKAKKYYYGKFSPSLDKTIDLAMEGKTEDPRVFIAVPKKTGVIPALPVPGEIHRRNKKGKSCKKFDARDPQNVFYMDARFDDAYICDPDSKANDALIGKVQIYALTKNGWRPELRDMIEDFDMYFEYTREEMDDIIKELSERGWFHDGVDTGKL